jgi:hypothetical protein
MNKCKKSKKSLNATCGRIAKRLPVTIGVAAIAILYIQAPSISLQQKDIGNNRDIAPVVPQDQPVIGATLACLNAT